MQGIVTHTSLCKGIVLLSTSYDTPRRRGRGTWVKRKLSRGLVITTKRKLACPLDTSIPVAKDIVASATLTIAATYTASHRMLVRVRCRAGNFRFTLEPTDDIQKLAHQIVETVPEVDAASLTFSNQPKGNETAVAGLSGSVASFGISHGDLLFVSWSVPQSNGTTHTEPVASTSSSNARPESNAIKKPWELAKEETVDRYWEQADGKIPRPRSYMCKHNERSMCDHCMPLEPYDATYQAEHKIKHLSFHSYLRKLDLAINKPSVANTSFVPPLDESDYTVKVPCPSGSHAPWPDGICTKCQPSAITLQLQQYRMVDHVEFASPSIINRFLDFWRAQANQRFGYLIGRYETYERVPMGVRAIVEAIHEPPQMGETDGIQIGFPWEEESRIAELAAQSGLRIVGVIFTDLTPDPDQPTKVLCKRHAKSFFLSGQEVLFAAEMQKRHPNESRFSSTGRFGSKFVTCVVTGNAQEEIEVQAYQASDQAVAMTSADMVEVSVDAGVVRIREDDGTKKRYVPDVFYRYKNEFGIEVKQSARPCFPVDYLLVSLTHGFPETPVPTFVAPDPSAFVIESRQGWQDQSQEKLFRGVAPILRRLPATLDAEGFEFQDGKGKGRESDAEALEGLATWLSDWHLLAYLGTLGVFDKASIQLLVNVAVARESSKRKQALNALLKSSTWQTFTTIALESAPESNAANSAGAGANSTMDADIPPEILAESEAAAAAAAAASVPGAGSESGMRACPHCTFENSMGATDCEVCGLPLAG